MEFYILHEAIFSILHLSLFLLMLSLPKHILTKRGGHTRSHQLHQNQIFPKQYDLIAIILYFSYLSQVDSMLYFTTLQILAGKHGTHIYVYSKKKSPLVFNECQQLFNHFFFHFTQGFKITHYQLKVVVVMQDIVKLIYFILLNCCRFLTFPNILVFAWVIPLSSKNSFCSWVNFMVNIGC